MAFLLEPPSWLMMPTMPGTQAVGLILFTTALLPKLIQFTWS